MTSTILGYSLRGTPVNGVAFGATVIPVKVLNKQSGAFESREECLRRFAKRIVLLGDLSGGGK